MESINNDIISLSFYYSIFLLFNIISDSFQDSGQPSICLIPIFVCPTLQQPQQCNLSKRNVFMGCLDIFRSESIPMSFVENKPAWQKPRNIRNVALRLNNPIFLMPWLRSVIRRNTKRQQGAIGNARQSWREKDTAIQDKPSQELPSPEVLARLSKTGDQGLFVWLFRMAHCSDMLGWFWMFCFSKNDPLCFFMFMFIEFERHHWGLIHWWSHWWENNHDYAWTQALGWRYVKSVTFLQLRLDEVSLGLITLVL